MKSLFAPFVCTIAAFCAAMAFLVPAQANIDRYISASPNGNRLTHDYDALNRKKASRDSLGSLGAWDYDGQGNVTGETDANGNTSTHVYDDLNRRTERRMPSAAGTLSHSNIQSADSSRRGRRFERLSSRSGRSSEIEQCSARVLDGAVAYILSDRGLPGARRPRRCEWRFVWEASLVLVRPTS